MSFLPSFSAKVLNKLNNILNSTNNVNPAIATVQTTLETSALEASNAQHNIQLVNQIPNNGTVPLVVPLSQLSSINAAGSFGGAVQVPVGATN